MGLGKKASVSRIDTLLHMNMGMQRYCRRSYIAEVDFTHVIRLMREFNEGKTNDEKVRIPGILIKAIALALDYIDDQGLKPYRRLSGYLPFFRWGGSWESDAIDISLMIVRSLDGVRRQTCSYTFKAANTINVVELSKRIWAISTKDEDEIPEFVFLKKISRLPMPLLFLLLQLTRIPLIRAQVVAPTSVSVLSDDVITIQGEHTSMFALARIDPETQKGLLQWTFDHRLGMGLHFSAFLAHVKHLIDSATFLQKEIEEYYRR